MIKNKKKLNNKANLENGFEGFVRKFHRRIINTVHDEACNLSLSISQVEVLRYVIDNKNPTMKDIASYLNIKPPSVTSIVEFLLQGKLLKKVVDKTDNRVTRVIITDKAYKTFLKVKNKKRLVIQRMFQSLSLKDKKEFIRILTILNK